MCVPVLMQTTVKLSLHTVARNASTTALIRNVVTPVNTVVALTYFVLRLYLSSLLNADDEVPPVDESLVRCAMWAVTKESRAVSTNMPIRERLIALIPVALRHSITLPSCSTQIMALERRKMITCMEVAVQQRFLSTVRCFVNRTLKNGIIFLVHST